MKQLPRVHGRLVVILERLILHALDRNNGAFAQLPDVYAEWCPNEKVALGVAVGASAAALVVLLL